MTPDNEKNNNQRTDFPKPSNNPKDYLKIKWLIIGALIASVPTFINSYINNSAEDKRILIQTKVARQNVDIEKGQIEIDNFIDDLNEFKKETNIILKNLTGSNEINEEDFYSPLMNIPNLIKSEKDLDDKISIFGRDVVPKLQNHYRKLTQFYNIPISEDVISSINGIFMIITGWYGHHTDKLTISPCKLNIPIWCPDIDFVVPPKNPEEVYSVILNKIDEQIKYLTKIRIRIRNGDFI